MNGNKKVNYYFKLITGLIVFVAFLSFTVNVVRADFLSGDEVYGDAAAMETSIQLNSISTFDQLTKAAVDGVKGAVNFNWNKYFTDKLKDAAKIKGWSSIYQSTISAALNKVAFDTATWLGSGSKGQKPMFVTEGWGAYLVNVADNAAGTFLEEVGKNKWGVKFNLCEPDFALKVKIGLGLRNQVKPSAPACTFSKMIKNWDKELKDPKFLNKFQEMFNPTSNDFGVALTLQTGMMENIQNETAAKTLERQTNKGWLDIKNLSGLNTSIPQIGEYLSNGLQGLMGAQFGKVTGDTLVDSANLFLNQLAITLVNEQLKKLGGKKTLTDFNWDSLTNPNASPGSGGIAGAKEQLRKIVEPKFNVRGDYNILGELSQCPNPTKAGPTNCVLEDKFSQAIQKKLTVGEAMKQGHLNANGTFGFTASTGLEPNYLEGYPYRSMMILRKFRILPVGWELAAQHIRDNQNDTGTRNLGDLIACFDQNDNYPGYYQPWCKGLVDPNWVLKAPLNYCRREGPGPEILSSSVSGTGADSQLDISRNDKYCGDEQSCIKENNDGSCQAYGYCTEERRKWKFSGEACEPIYNTCQTFKASDNKSVSYLENTLDYSGCSVDNVGCLAYCTDYNNATGNYNCTNASVNDKIYLDNGAEVCDAKNEGCHEFVRTKIGLEANLLLNSSFEEPLSVGGWTGIAAGTSTTSYDGLSSLELNVGSNQKIATTAPSGYNIGDTNGDVYTLSFYSYGCAASSTFKVDTFQPGLFDIAVGTGWLFNQAAYVVPQAVLGNRLTLNFNSVAAGCLIDAVKLERGYKATAYNSYQNNNKVYEKLLPGYLQPACYDASWNLLPNAPVECSNFARMCRTEEVGCELFTSTEDKMAVPAKVGAQNYCVPECVGFKAYLATETYFDSSRQEKFIPKTAQSCSAADVGCDEFTNLDKVAAGGEAVENYSYLRQCVKPAAPLANCSEFYTWEGSSESGFQLRVVSLDSDPAAATPNPRVTDPVTDTNNCNETIYNLAPTDPAYNADCREFYNTSGLKFYHLYTLTVSCDEDCHPYRRTEVNIDITIPNSNCLPPARDRNWADHNGDGSPECAVCKNGGEWSSEHNACIYNAIPSQGRTCRPAAAGCREYTGASGRNIRVVLNNDIEDGTMQNWNGVGLSTESIVVGGHSLSVGAQINKDVTKIVQPEKSYILSFIAKSNGAMGTTSLSAQFQNSAGSSTPFGSVVISGEWQIYELNLARIDHDLSLAANVENLYISGVGGNFYIDNIKLTEIIDRYYLIKNSWATPAVCHADLSGNPSTDYMLGCEEYTDREQQTHYLRSFAYLCSESAVGCEMMIDTQNSASPATENFNSGAPVGDEVNILADEYVYAVFDKKKQCNQEDKGCQRLGKPYNYESTVVYSDVYLKNNPDKYSSAMCTYDAVNCGEYTTAAGLSYFKNPGDQICEWRQPAGGTNWGWYRKKINRCDINLDGFGEGAVCLSDKNCATSQKCLIENADQACTLEWFKTIGVGGSGNVVGQPAGDWVGRCPADAAGCTELIDPISSFSSNLIFNNDFKNIDNDPAGVTMDHDGWNGSPPGPFSQSVNLENFTLYRLAGTDPLLGNNVSLNCTSPIYGLSTTTNSLDYLGLVANLPLAADTRSLIFYSASSSACTVTVNNERPNIQVEIKKAVVDYQLKETLNAQECNGTVNFDDGCVLFNERSMRGASINGLIYDADRSIKTPSPQSDGTQDSNTLLKVEPDRVCDKWLACRSKIAVKNDKGEDENYCFDVGLCNGLDQNGNCSSFLLAKKENQTYPSPVGQGQAANLSGYAKVGDATNSGYVEPNDYYPLAAMEQVGKPANLSNGSFELAGSNGYPVGWNWEQATINAKSWDASVFKVIDNPIAAQNEGVSYPMDGKKLLRLGSSFNATSEFIDVSAGDYILSAYINTKNSSAGTARAAIKTDTGVTLQAVPAVALDSGKDWTFKLGVFNIASGVNRIKIVLYSDNNPIGNFYFDNVTLHPALESKQLPTSLWYTPASCRLYPQGDALSCEYYNDSGVREKGWYGYCLEHDRSPGSADACLLWWPVDKIQGEGIEEGGGYNGRQPLYYCLEGTAQRKYEYRHAFYVSPGRIDGCGADKAAWLPCWNQGYTAQEVWRSKNSGWDNVGCVCIPDGKDYITLDGNVTADTTNINASADTYSKNDGWYPYNGSLLAFNTPPAINQTTNSNHFMDLCNAKETSVIRTTTLNSCTLTAELSRSVIECDKLAQTVTPIGTNKYWSGRVYAGSDYVVPQLNLNYKADYPPFGSIVPPVPSSNPYEWDSKLDVKGNAETLGRQPLYEEYSDAGQARAGKVYDCINPAGESENCNNVLDTVIADKIPYYARAASTSITSINLVKRLFAQSYGVWDWGGVCENTGSSCQVDADCYSCGSMVGTCSQNSTMTCNGDAACQSVVSCAAPPTATTCNDVGGTCTANVCSNNSNFGCVIDADCGECSNNVVGVKEFSCSVGAGGGQCGRCSFDNPAGQPISCANTGDCQAFVSCVNMSGTCDNDPSIICTNASACSTGGGYCERRYHQSSVTPDWNSPTSLCIGGARPVYDPENKTCAGGNCFACSPMTNTCDFCAVLPTAFNVKINQISATDFTINKNGMVNLTFNSRADSQQLPLVMYEVDWGDGETTLVSGVEMRDRPNPDNPHSLYHLYNYWDLRAKDNIPDARYGGIDCTIAGECHVIPSVKIKDNWGWCNGDTTIGQCTTYVSFPHEVIVREN